LTLDFEFKETFNTLVRKDGVVILGLPNATEIKYPWDSDWVVCACYQREGGEWPTERLFADDAYLLGISATWFLLGRKHGNNKWSEIGGTEEFIRWFARKGEGEFSWPEPYMNHRTFKMEGLIDIHPWREVIRRHVDQKLYIFDRDLSLIVGSKYKTR
jgi:hypothetical protein